MIGIAQLIARVGAGIIRVLHIVITENEVIIFGGKLIGLGHANIVRHLATFGIHLPLVHDASDHVGVFHVGGLVILGHGVLHGIVFAHFVYFAAFSEAGHAGGGLRI